VTGGRILLVEDESIIAMDTCFMLRERGYSVEHVLTGEAALERIGSDPGSVDLILMDINLGKGMSGPEAAREILASREIPVVFLSSHTEPAIVESTEAVSSYGYVVKNSGITVLDASIKMAFRLFEARKSINVKNMAIEASNETLRITVEELTESNRRLALSEDKFQKAFRSSPDSININRLEDGAYIDINQGFTAITGYTREDVIGRSSLPGDLGIWVRAEDRAELVAALRESGEMQGLEAQFRRKDGSVLTGLMSARLIEIEGQTCLLSVTRDITERKEAENRLLESESRFRAAFANAPVGMAILSPELGLRMANKAFCSMLGYTMLEVCSLDFRSFLTDEAASACEEAARWLLEGEAGPIRLEARLRAKDGSAVWADERISLIRSEGGSSQALVVHTLDISLRKRAETAAAKIERIRVAVSEAIWLLLKDVEARPDLDRSCELLVKKGGLRMAWAGLLDEEGYLIQPLASAGDVGGFFDVFSPPSAPARASGLLFARGALGRAISEGRSAVSEDIATDEGMIPWRDRALERGYRSAAAVPILSNARVVGVYMAYADESGFFGPTEVQLLEQLALAVSSTLDAAGKQLLRVEHEKKLRDSETLYRASFLQSSAVIFLVDPETETIADANFAAAEYHGYPVSAMRGKRLLDIVSDPMETFRSRMEGMRSGRESHFYSHHRRASGETREVEVYANPIQIAGRTLIHTIIHDVTEQRHVERALRDSENRFRAAFDQAPVGMSLTAPDGRLAEVNQAFCDMIGRPAEEIIGRAYAAITYPDDVAPSNDLVRSCLKGERTSGRMVKRYLHAEGKPIWADVSIALIRDEDSSPEVFITHMLDITERKKAEDALERLLGEKDTLMRELQHRVKNNLGVVISLLNLEEGRSTDGPAKSVLSDSISRVRSIAAIYERLYLSEDLSLVDLALYVEDLATSLFATYILDPSRVSLSVQADQVRLDTKRSVPLGLIPQRAPDQRPEVRLPRGRERRDPRGPPPRRGEDRLERLRRRDLAPRRVSLPGEPEHGHEAGAHALRAAGRLLEHRQQGRHADRGRLRPVAPAHWRPVVPPARPRL
jgi:PAS domain S-box-containing protein